MQYGTSFDSKSDLATVNHMEPKPKQEMTPLMWLSHVWLYTSLIYTSWPSSKTMVNLQRVFAAVLLDLVQQPPLVMNFPDFMEVDHEARLPALASLCEKEQVRKQQASRKTLRPER
jgi:hypothetical protein